MQTCKHCGSVLSAVTWNCVRGEHCPDERISSYVIQRQEITRKGNGHKRISWRSIPEHIPTATTAHWRKRNLEQANPGAVYRVLEIINPA